MMKYLLFSLLFTSCALEYGHRTRSYVRPETVIEKTADCVERYISKHGVRPMDALNICNKLYRGIEPKEN